MISVLIPIYNGIEFIEESVSSVIKQTFTEWELIIGINGHSEDSDVFKIAKKYEERDSRIRTVHLNTVGKSHSLNEMVREARFEWISVLDVDDIWFSTKLFSQLQYMEKYDVIGTKCQYFQESTIIPNIPVGDLTNFPFYNCNPIINSSCLVRKKMCHWEEVPGLLDDYDMWLRLWKEKRAFFNVRSIQVLHRIHSQSAFNSKGNSGYVPALIEKHKAEDRITFATCWYSVHSKFDSETYGNWMKNILHHVKEFNLVVFTNNESKHLIEKYVEESSNPVRIKIVIREFEQFHSYQWKDNWIENHTKNHSLNKITGWKLNMIWNEKVHFVQSSMKIFRSRYYGWMDIGYFRDKPVSPNWPCTSNLSPDKIMYAIVCDKEEYEGLKTIIKHENENFMPYNPIPPGQISVAGGFFVTHRQHLVWWHDTYYTRLKQYFENEYLVKDDQMIILDCIIHNENKFALGWNGFPKHSSGRWFFFRDFLNPT